MERKQVEQLLHIATSHFISECIQRDLYVCSCGWSAQSDVNGALNIYEKAYKVSPVKGSSGRVARPAVVSYHLGWHGVAEPKHEGNLICASA
ncbi:transposase [Caldicoprobacter guelmensis]|nr:transposase [Caldicoprobacter guelmensis]